MDKFTMIGDIGGTNARLALVDNDGSVNNPVIYKVATTKTLVDAVSTYINKECADLKVTALVAAAAGPVLSFRNHARVQFTNTPWICDQVQLAKALSLKTRDVTIINDYQAAAYAVLALDRTKDFERFRLGRPDLHQPVLIVGPGTGLGVGRLTSHMADAVALATEGPHTVAAVVNERQSALREALRIGYFGKSRFSNEDLYSFGRGLPNLHLANRIIKGEKLSHNDLVTPEEVTYAAQKGDKTSISVLNDFSFGLGVAAGNMALNPLSYGGIYLVGVNEVLGDLFNRRAFFNGLKENDKPELVARMPVHHIVKNIPAFDGLAHYISRQVQDWDELPSRNANRNGPIVQNRLAVA